MVAINNMASSNRTVSRIIMGNNSLTGSKEATSNSKHMDRGDNSKLLLDRKTIQPNGLRTMLHRQQHNREVRQLVQLRQQQHLLQHLQQPRQMHNLPMMPTTMSSGNMHRITEKKLLGRTMDDGLLLSAHRIQTLLVVQVLVVRLRHLHQLLRPRLLLRLLSRRLKTQVCARFRIYLLG